MSNSHMNDLYSLMLLMQTVAKQNFENSQHYSLQYSVFVVVSVYRVSQKTCLLFERQLWRSHESNFPVDRIYEQNRLQLGVWHQVWVDLTRSCWFMEQESQIYRLSQNQRIWCSPSMLKTKKFSVKMSLAQFFTFS